MDGPKVFSKLLHDPWLTPSVFQFLLPFGKTKKIKIGLNFVQIVQEISYFILMFGTFPDFFFNINLFQFIPT